MPAVSTTSFDRARGLSLGRARRILFFSLAGSLLPTTAFQAPCDLARDPGLDIDIDRNTVPDVGAGWGFGREFPAPSSPWP